MTDWTFLMYKLDTNCVLLSFPWCVGNNLHYFDFPCENLCEQNGDGQRGKGLKGEEKKSLRLKIGR
jgi:hypothetical protein